MNRRAPFLLTALLLSPTGQAQDPSARIDAWLQPHVADGQLSGALLIARGSDIVVERYFGFANHELQAPVTADTRFGIASVTKPMTQFVVIQLLLGGKLGVDDKIAKWLPDFPNAATITVDHLLNHRAGIPHRVTSTLDEVLPQSAASMTALAAARPSIGVPGERSVYSSAGYAVLARVAELAGAQPFAALLQQHVFDPAGMTQTVDATSRSLIPQRAASYAMGAAGPLLVSPKDLTFLVGAGSVFSTPRDLHRLVQAVVDGKLGPSVRANALSRGRIDWNGAVSGYRCFVQHDPDSGFTVIWAGNIATGAIERMRVELLRLLRGEEVAAPARLDVTPTAMPAGLADELTGAWDFQGQALDLRVIDGQVWLGDVVLVPTGKDQFFSFRDYGTVAVAREEHGGVRELQWRGEAGVTSLLRVR
ncbi:MAG: beta-lactamase family protein [Planctomycetes bacterium]|nr:beta-lactamase family protein [Planctomycetota bacterium]